MDQTVFSSMGSDSALVGEKYRITPLTPRLVRIEWSPSGTFEDRPTTFAVNRDLPVPEFDVVSSGTGLRVVTGCYVLDYDRGPLTSNGLSVAVRGGVSTYHSVWRYGQDLSLPADRQLDIEGRPPRNLDGNLGGATRTLDVADGEVPLDPGVNSTLGYAVVDDSHSMVVDADGHLIPRNPEFGYRDLYVFAAGHDHVGAVSDLFAVSGPQPLLPRFALGNWWSRYYRYDSHEYLDLMDRFRAEGIPMSVAVVDMDWHQTDVDPRFGSGWTGYTWNRDLFPSPSAFQQQLHDRGLKVALNVHPADGVRAFEEIYEQMCSRMGRSPDGTPVDFDVSDPRFMSAYFDVVIRGLEDLGTDFWWIDWQSGPYSKVAGMDPLWVLNRAHYKDNSARVGRGLILSRYAGPGSHRYPVGFSGDTVITWRSLAFQPRMTAAAANIGFGWWSHDIGGHMGGLKDDELATRWVEFGVFSPIMRLHSGNSQFSGKEPWNFADPGRSAMVAHLRLRHRLLPYLNSMNLRAHEEGRSIVEPVYFESSEPEAYRYLDEYLFGSQLLVAPVIRPGDPRLRRASVDVWLPSGRWTDIVTGHSYSGSSVVRVYRDISSIPVLLRAGGFLPLVAEGEPLRESNLFPQLDVLVAGGASGAFSLAEETAQGDWHRTMFSLDVDEGTIRIDSPWSVADGRSGWTFSLIGFDMSDDAEFTVEGGSVEKVSRHHDRIRLRVRSECDQMVLHSELLKTRGQPDVLEEVEDLLASAQIGYTLKDQLLSLVKERGSLALAAVPALGAHPTGHSTEVHDYDRPTPELIEALTELLGPEA